ncbi:hypothetical protein AN958_08492 [Leucoagaricus sp. SymC.cos]|nr:hypothetical protein AN958_08492 [Leucoagaricus sp. SymC.cos]
MARATRSGANAEPGIKKRKRNSSPHERPHKAARTDLASGVGDSTLEEGDARKILQVLEESDRLGLLDRVFPLSESSEQSLSLRAVLEQPQLHSLRVVRTAIHNLRPRAVHPRSTPSDTAAQQLSFCALALSLLDQASRNIPLLTPFPSDILDEPASPKSPSSPRHRYALVQHLPSGDYWSSLSSQPPSSFLKDLPTAHAELVSILPTPSSSQSSKPVPTLGSYAPTKSHPKKPITGQRPLTIGSFLDYGPWATFAPSFDHDCELVGRRELGEVLWYKRERKAQREADLREWIEGRGSIMEVDEPARNPEPFNVQAEFDGILPPEDIENLKAALDNAELEILVDELLTRNSRALIRLQELQIDRLTKEGASTPTVDRTSEEWQIAHGIMESLETLTSLRPRASSGDIVSIIPPPSVLHKLHKTLALEPHPGWHGTLVPTRATTLCDDSTVKVRATSVSAAPAPASTSSSPAPTSITPAAPTAAPTTTPYTGYTYAYPTQQAQAYRPTSAAVPATAYTPYKPGATSYYQNYAQQQQQYYGQQAYGAGATSQQPYAAYSNWFAHAQQYAASAATATGRGTPQPATSTAATAAAAYGAYYQQPAAATQQQQRTVATTTPTPAVANTAAMNKATTANVGAAGVWGGYALGQQPTLPERTGTTPATATTAAASTPVVTNGYQQQNYYGAYQQAPQQQASTAR